MTILSAPMFPIDTFVSDKLPGETLLAPVNA